MVSGPRKARLRKVTFYVVDIVVDHYEDFIYSSQMTVHSVNPFSSTKKATHFLQDSQFQSTKTNNIYSKLHTQFHFPKLPQQSTSCNPFADGGVHTEVAAVAGCRFARSASDLDHAQKKDMVYHIIIIICSK